MRKVVSVKEEGRAISATLTNCRDRLSELDFKNPYSAEMQPMIVDSLDMAISDLDSLCDEED